jgi:hypothetical protein
MTIAASLTVGPTGRVVIMEFDKRRGDGQYNCLDARAIVLSAIGLSGPSDPATLGTLRTAGCDFASRPRYLRYLKLGL